MSEKRYNVPDEMMKAAISRHDAIFPGFVRSHRDIDGISAIVEAVLRYQAENPATPNHEQAIHLCEVFEDRGRMRKDDYCDSIRAVAVEWQRRAYLVVEPELPEAIKDLVTGKGDTSLYPADMLRFVALESYRRGKEGK